MAGGSLELAPSQGPGEELVVARMRQWWWGWTEVDLVSQSLFRRQSDWGLTDWMCGKREREEPSSDKIEGPLVPDPNLSTLHEGAFISPSHEHLDEENGYIAWFCGKQHPRPKADAYCVIRKSDPKG